MAWIDDDKIPAPIRKAKKKHSSRGAVKKKPAVKMLSSDLNNPATTNPAVDSGSGSDNLKNGTAAVDSSSGSNNPTDRNPAINPISGPLPLLLVIPKPPDT